MMNYDVESPSPSTADADRQTQDGARTTDRRSAVSSGPDEDDGAAANDWCAWCGRGPSTDEDFGVDETWPSAADDNDDQRRRRPSYDQLRFCSRSCVSRYKMDLFCRETQRYLQQLQGNERLSGGSGSDESKEPRILITPELWSQTDSGDDHHDHGVNVDRQCSWNDSDDGATGRRRSNGDRSADEIETLTAARHKVRKINVSDRLTASRKSTRYSTSDGAQSTYLKGAVSRTPVQKDTTTTGGFVKSESGVADGGMGDSRPGLTGVSLPWMSATSTPISSSLSSPFQRGFLTSALWPHSPAGFPPTHVRPPPPSSFAAAASMPLGFGAAGWPPAGLVPPPTAMLVPYPIPIPLPLPLPIPVPVPISKFSLDSSGEVANANESGENSSHERNETTNASPEKSKDDPRSTSESTTLKSISVSSSEAWNVLDLSTSSTRSRSTDLSSIKVVWTEAVTTASAVSSTIDASPYLARRSLILDAPAVDRKCFGDQPASARSSSSVTAVNKRFNHHRRRTTPMPLVKSK